MDQLTNTKKQRGWFLTFMIAFLVLGDIQIPYYLWINPDALSTVYSSVPSWYVPYALVGLASNIAIIIGIWFMKRWAVYLLVAYFVSKILVDVFYIIPSQMLPVFATTLVGAGLWFWAVALKWKSFD